MNSKRFFYFIAINFILLHVSTLVSAETLESITQMKNEAQKILQGASSLETDPKVYAEALRKLARAEHALDALGGARTAEAEKLMEEISAALFWARKFTTLEIINELDRAEKNETRPPPKSVTPPVSEPRKPPTIAEGKPPELAVPPSHGQPSVPSHSPDLDAAEKEFRRCEQFELANAEQPHGVALRWFQFADRFPGTDLALKALTRARAAQINNEAMENAKTVVAKTKIEAELSDDSRLLAEGNRLFSDRKYNEALKKFEEAKQLKATTEAETAIANTFMTVALNYREEYIKKYTELEQKAIAARQSRNTALLRALSNELSNLNAKVGNSALHCYQKATEAFNSGLRLANQKNLECEAGIAMLYYYNAKPGNNPFKYDPAKRALAEVLRKYHPQNDRERTVFEACRTLLAMLNNPPKTP